MKKSLKCLRKVNDTGATSFGKVEDQGNVSSERDTNHDNQDEPPAKRRKQRGMNKNRPRAVQLDFKQQLCGSVSRGDKCEYGDRCRYLHDAMEYVSKYKLPDVGDSCVHFEKFGKCIFGLTCRYGKKHITESFQNIVNLELHEKTAALRTKNVLSRDLVVSLRKKTYPFPRSGEYLKHLQKVKDEGHPNNELGSLVRHAGAVTDEDVIRLRPEEKTKVQWCFVFLQIQWFGDGLSNLHFWSLIEIHRK